MNDVQLVEEAYVVSYCVMLEDEGLLCLGTDGFGEVMVKVYTVYITAT